MVRRVNESQRRAADEVELAKAALVAAAPGRRAPGVPLAEAIAAFEEHLREARGIVTSGGAAWEEPDRSSCERGIDEALRVATWLRLEAEPEGYESLYPILDDVMRPLEVFEGLSGRGSRR